MSKHTDVRQQLADLIRDSQPIDPYDLRRAFEEAILMVELAEGWEESQKGRSWTDDELRVVLSDALTKSNCLKHARSFKRGYGSIEQIYRWAATPSPKIEEKGRGEDSFIKQVKRIAKQLGWRA